MNEFPSPTRKLVDLSKIKCVRRYYPRKTFDLFRVKRFQALMESGDKFPPITVAKDKTAIDSYILIDGWYRFEAMKALDLTRCVADVLDIEPKYFLLTAGRLNLHGQPAPTPEEVRKIIREDLRDQGLTEQEIEATLNRDSQ